MIALNYLFEAQPGQIPTSSAMLLRTNQSRQKVGQSAIQSSTPKLQPVLNGKINPLSRHPIIDPATTFIRNRQLNSLNLSGQK